MKTLRIISIALLTLVFFAGQGLAGEDSNSSGLSSGILTEHRTLVDRLNQLTSGNLKIKTFRSTGKVSYIGGDPSHPIRQPAPLGPEATSENAARGFLSIYGPLFGLKDQARELKLMRDRKADRGRSSVRFQQVHSGIPIFGGELIVQTDSSNNIISAHGKILPDIDVETTPATISEVADKKAREVVQETYQSKYEIDQASLRVSTPELWIYNPILLGEEEYKTYLVWRMEVTTKELLPIRELVLVDAQSGEVVLHFNQIDAVLNRKIYDHNNTWGKSLPGSLSDLKRSEGQGATGIADVDYAYDYAGDTYNFYFSYHGRESINNAGMSLISTTRYCPNSYYCPYENAFWNGTQMVYGEGYASADDVVAHEMTHGVTQYESKLIYNKQSGAINETFSDIWGEFVDLTNTGGDDTPGVRWLMGEDIPGGAIRNMANPPAFGDPDRVWSSSYWCFLCDNGGVHINSGIGNKAAYLMTDGGSFNGITVTGIGITKVAKIFYEAQAYLLTSASDFGDLAIALEQACVDLIGTDGITASDCQQVEKAIDATELDHQPPINKLKNPGFESGSLYWTQGHSGPYSVFAHYAGYGACGSNWFVYLADYSNAKDYIYQDVTIPSNATQATAQFLYAIVPYYSGSDDYMWVEIKDPGTGALLAELDVFSNADDTGGYWAISPQYNLLSFKGQTVRLRFYATNDADWDTTAFFLDDIVLKVVGGDLPVVTSFRINGGATSTAKQTVTLNNTATNAPTQFKASESPTFDGAFWQAYSTAPSFKLSAGGNTKTVYFKVRNGMGESNVESRTIDPLIPAVTSFKINAGASKTTNASVTLNNTATNFPEYYKASESDTFDGAIWQKYSTAPSFALSSGAGIKTVYFKVKNSFDESADKNYPIEALAPSVTMKINANAASTANSVVTLNNVATNSPTHYIASEDSGFSGALWQPYSAAPKLTLSDGAGPKTVHFKVKNSIGESETQDDILAAGSAPVLTSFKINAGALKTANATVTLNNTATNAPTHYWASEDPGFGTGNWQPYSTAPKFTLSAGAGKKTVYFKVKNIFGVSGDKNYPIEALAPAVTLKINAGATSTANSVVTLNNVATNSPTHYIASEDSGFSGALWQPYSAAPKFTLSYGSGSKTVHFKVKNSVGESETQDDISATGGVPPVLTSFTINAGVTSTAKGIVTLNNVATNSPTHYKASEDPGFALTLWEPYSTAPKFTLSAGSGPKIVYFKTRNIFGESLVKSDSILALAPAVTSFKINAGAASTANGTVTLNNTATNLPTHYWASEDPGFGTGSWQPYSTAPTFTLNPGKGTNIVYFKVKNSFVESNVMSDAIEADGLPPVVTSFKINAGAASTTNALVTLNNTGTNSPMYYMASEDPNFVGASWLIYSTAPKLALSAGSGTKTVYFKTQNIFGDSSIVSDTIFLY